MKNKYFFKTIGFIFTLGLLLLGSYTQAQNRNFLDFDGSNDYVYRIDNSVLDRMNNASEYTIEAWIYISSWTDYQRIANRYSHWDFYLRENGQLAFRVNVSGTWKRNYSVNNAVSTGSWQHVAVIRESGKIHFYVNGVNKDAGSYSGYTLPGASADDHLYIGQFGSTTAGAKGTNLFNGYIDEFRCKNVAENIADLSTSVYDNQYTPDGNTGALFHFNEGTGTSTVEATQGYNATLYGTPDWRAWNYASSDHLPLANEWTGGKSTDNWDDADNWGGGIPDTTNDVLIPDSLTYYPTISSDDSCNNLLMESGASLIISGTLTKSTSGTITAQRYIGAWGTGTDHGWHLISSPVDAQAISDFHTAGSSSNDFYKWDEASDIWVNRTASDGTLNSSFETNFEVGKGYLIAYGSAVTKNFTGTFNTANDTVSSLSKDHEGWHLLGNPFPSSLLWDKTAADWNLSNVYPTAKIWKESTAAYVDLTAGDTIPSMQGFMVQASAASASLIIPASDRVHSTVSWYKNVKSEENTLKLTVSEEQNNTAQESIIRINEDATTGFDPQFDSHFLTGFAPQFYSVLEDGSAVSTNTLPDVSENTTIPFAFIKNSATDYTLTVEGVNSLTTGEKVYLTDLKTNYTQNLNENPVYHFSAQDGDAVNRFKLYFSPLSVNENSVKSLYSVYASHNLIKIQAEKAVNADVYVYNVAGQLVAKTTLNQQSYTSIDMKDFKGMAVVSIVSAGTARNHKVIVY